MTELPIESPKEIGRRLNLTRIALGYRNATEMLAAVTSGEISPQQWSNWKRGRFKPHLDEAMVLCHDFGLTLEWIYRGRPDYLPDPLKAEIRRLQAGNGLKLVRTARR